MDLRLHLHLHLLHPRAPAPSTAHPHRFSRSSPWIPSWLGSLSHCPILICPSPSTLPVRVLADLLCSVVLCSDLVNALGRLHHSGLHNQRLRYYSTSSRSLTPRAALSLSPISAKDTAFLARVRFNPITRPRRLRPTQSLFVQHQYQYQHHKHHDSHHIYIICQHHLVLRPPLTQVSARPVTPSRALAAACYNLSTSYT